MNTTENNILIAEFLGQKETISNFPQFGYMTVYGDWKNEFTPNELKFHSDWNWLMEVVEKCLIGEAEHNEINIQKAISEIYEGLCSINILSTHKACVEFIKLYNQNN
jgi:hypothetical protein